MFQCWLQDLLLFSCCTPETSLPDSCMTQSLCFFFLPFSSTSLLIDLRTFSATPGKSLCCPSMMAVISSTKTFRFNGGNTFITSFKASHNTMRRSKQLHPRQREDGPVAAPPRTLETALASGARCTRIAHAQTSWEN